MDNLGNDGSAIGKGISNNGYCKAKNPGPMLRTEVVSSYVQPLRLSLGYTDMMSEYIDAYTH